jgi:GxxExxY protein
MATVQEREAAIDVEREGGQGHDLIHGELTGEIIAGFYAVYNELGYGFLESVYIRALAVELFARRMNVAREVPVTVFYKGVTVGNFRADLLVADTVVVKVTSGDDSPDGDRAQLLNFLRSSGKEVGLLLHFGPRAVLRRVVYTRRSERTGPVGSPAPAAKE